MSSYCVGVTWAVHVGGSTLWWCRSGGWGGGAGNVVPHARVVTWPWGRVGRGAALATVKTLLPFYVRTRGSIEGILFVTVSSLHPALKYCNSPCTMAPGVSAFTAGDFLFRGACYRRSIDNPSQTSLLAKLHPSRVKIASLGARFERGYPCVAALPRLFGGGKCRAVNVNGVCRNDAQARSAVS